MQEQHAPHHPPRGDRVLSTCHWKMTLQAPAVGEAHKVFICSNSDRQDTEASADLPLMRRLPAGWGGFQIALLKLNSPAGTQDTPGELAIVPACGVAVLVTEGRELRSPAGSTAD